MGNMFCRKIVDELFFDSKKKGSLWPFCCTCFFLDVCVFLDVFTSRCSHHSTLISYSKRGPLDPIAQAQLRTVAIRTTRLVVGSEMLRENKNGAKVFQVIRNPVLNFKALFVLKSEKSKACPLKSWANFVDEVPKVQGWEIT